MRKLAALVGLGILASCCQAQQDAFAQGVIARANGLDAREAIRKLFKAVGVSFSFSPNYEQSFSLVSLNLHGVTFEEALNEIMRQSSGTYRSGGGVIQIVLKEPPSPGDVAHFDPPYIDIQGVDSRKALATILQSYGIKTLLQPAVRGRITYRGVPSSIPDLLQTLSGQVGCIYRNFWGNYELLKPSSGSPVFAWIADLPYSKATVLQDGDFLYTVSRDRLSKKGPDGRIVATTTLRPAIPATVLDLSKAPDRQKLTALAKLADSKLEIAPEATGIVRIDAGLATAERLESCISKSLKIAPSKTFGRSLLLQRLNDHVYLNLFDFVPVGEHTFPAAAIQRAGNLLQVDAGRWRFLCDPDDLSIVKWEARPAVGTKR